MSWSNETRTVIIVSEDAITFKAQPGFLWSTGTSTVGYEVTNIIAAKEVLKILAEPMLKDNRC